MEQIGALRDAGRDVRPLCGRDQERQRIELPRPIRALRIGIDDAADAHVANIAFHQPERVADLRLAPRRERANRRIRVRPPLRRGAGTRHRDRRMPCAPGQRGYASHPTGAVGRPASELPCPSSLPPGLAPDESAAVSRLLEAGAALLMDERAGRAHALSLGPEVPGILGVLVRARRRGFIGPLAPLLGALRASGQRLSEALMRQALAGACEVANRATVFRTYVGMNRRLVRKPAFTDGVVGAKAIRRDLHFLDAGNHRLALLRFDIGCAESRIPGRSFHGTVPRCQSAPPAGAGFAMRCRQ